MKRILVMTMFLYGAIVATAQQPPKPATPPVPEPTPQLSSTEKIAVQALVDKFQAAQKAMQEVSQMFQQVDADVQRAHPGYHLDPGNPSILAKDTPRPAPPAPAPPKVEEKKK